MHTHSMIEMCVHMCVCVFVCLFVCSFVYVCVRLVPTGECTRYRRYKPAFVGLDRYPVLRV